MFSETFLSDLLKKSLSKGGDFADVFIEDKQNAVITYDSKKIKSINSGIISGIGIRIIQGTSYTYAYASNPTEQNAMALAEQISQAMHGEFKGNLGEIVSSYYPPIHSIKQYPQEVHITKKIEMIKRADEEARGYNSLIKDVIAQYWDYDQKVQFANSEGLFVKDHRIRTCFMVDAIAQKGEIKEFGSFSPGKSMGFEFFDDYAPESIAKEAARIALVRLNADYAPQGKMPVVVENGFGGVIFHEACGHALETTSVADNASVFSGKMGEQIASSVVNAVDDGTIPNAWGSATLNDEGAPHKKIQLIKDGILTSYMSDKLGAIKMDMESTGSSRRESYKYAPASRMTNTFIEPGTKTVEEMISSIDSGLYCKSLGGGSVNPPTTDFNFGTRECYLIKNGKLDKAVKGASLIGKGSEILKNIEMVGNNLALGAGSCGSVSGSIPTNVGQPAIKVTGLVVGGRQ